jgi:Ecdysteroid kinase-like family
MTTEPLPEAAGAEHLTAALRRAGALGDGRVASVAVESTRATILSRIIRLRLGYDSAPPSAPDSLILKLGLPDRADGNTGGRHEIAFYNEVAPASPAGVVPYCFEAAWDEPKKAWHMLLEDLTDTHAVAEQWPLPPPAERLRAILRARARFHAAWWDDPRLGVSIGKWADAAEIEQHQRRFAAQYAIFSDRLGERLPRERRDLYERFIAAAPRLTGRYASRRHMTIIHGDAHVWNCLLPRDGGGDVRLFDWDFWRLDTASDDLAYMMALHWYPDYRRQMERPLLDDYHAGLVEHGVRGYDRAALDDDYRLSALWQITIPVWQQANGIPPLVWWHNLERSMLAVDDLGCRALLM